MILDGMPAPQLRVYPRYTVVAEKLDAMVSLGILNSRMKDYFDLWILARHTDFDGTVLTKAVRATLERRGTPTPSGLPLGLSDEFAQDAQKNQQWSAFLRKNALEPMTLAAVIVGLREFLMPVLGALAAGEVFSCQWQAGGGWAAAGSGKLPRNTESSE